MEQGYIESWKEYQQKIPDQTEEVIQGLNEFFQWFKGFDINSMAKDIWIYRDIYHKLPFTISKVLNELYKMMGINIFEHTPVRPNARQKKSVQEFS